MSSPALVGTDASRPRSRILTPSSEGSLARNDGRSSPERGKSKRADSIAMDHLLKPSIALKLHPPNLQTLPRALQPLMVLPRKHLPLSCIDFNSASSELVPGRLFESHIKILDLESRMGSTPVVLLARSESSRRVFALERQDTGLYVTCRLGTWIDLETLAEHATAIIRERLRPTSQRGDRDKSQNAPMTTPQIHKDQKVKRAAIEAIQSLVRKRARSQSVCTQDYAPKQDGNVETSDPAAPLSVPPSLPSPVLKQEDAPDGTSLPQAADVDKSMAAQQAQYDISTPQQTSLEIFENIKTQYFDALYKSMGSLAYFAKGPLSRARSAFHLDLEANLDMSELIEFLKSLVLTTVQIDKKYRDTMPEVIEKMDAVLLSSDEGPKRARRSRKMKLGKNCLYTHEEDHIEAWWALNKPELGEEEMTVPVHKIKSLTSMLRTRETQLQMILILEILALSPLQTTEDAEDGQLPLLPGSIETEKAMAPPPPKKRNKHNLPVLVDVHADRLTIWQSTASDEQLLLEDSQVSLQHSVGQAIQKASSEPLKDFCVDVVVPFFSARLPELCDSINRKLGGPTILKPSKSRGLKRTSSKRDQKPGAVTKRSGPMERPRTLQRALSTEQQHRRSVSRGPSNMIALMRSASSTSLSIKREGSEPAAAARPILKGDSDLLNKRGAPLPRSNSVANLEDAKSAKRAMVEAELKDAISTLRKPNREVVGKAIAEAAEQRAMTSHSAKKVRKPARSVSGAVQVKATPTNNRFIDVFGPKSEVVAEAALPDVEEVIPPSSISSMIPSTGLRGAHRDAFHNDPSPTLDRVGSTPTKASRTLDFLPRRSDADFAIPPSSPIMERKPPNAGLAPEDETPTLLRAAGVLTTPVRAAPAKLASLETPSRQPEGKKLSIYQRLGWDDDLDDLI